MTSRSLKVVAVSAAVLAAISLSGGETAAETAGVDPCRSASPRAVAQLRKIIDGAYIHAMADAKKNGASGEYAVAATNSRDLLKRALDRADRAETDIRASNPRVTTAAEAGQLKEHVRNILEVVPQATHWAVISEIYHDSPDARRAFEGGISILEASNELFAESSRCYMNGL